MSVGKAGLGVTHLLPRINSRQFVPAERWILAGALATAAHLLGTECFACGPPPMVMPLGLWPAMVSAYMPMGVFMVMANIAAPAVLLRLFLRDTSLWLHLGRSVFVYLVSQLAEALLMAVLMAFVHVTGFDVGADVGEVVAAALMLFFGGAAAFGVMCLLYRDASWRKNLPLAFGFILVGYAAAVIVLVILGEWWW